MSHQSLLQAARVRVSQLAGLDQAALRTALTELDDLLRQAEQRGEGASADELRHQLHTTLDQSATFTSTMVHELRKPMTSIRGYSDMLAKKMVGDLTPMQQQFIDTIRTNIIRMEWLVSDISDMNKLAVGRLKLERKPYSLEQIFGEAKKDVDPYVTEYGHTLLIDAAPGLPPLNIDGKQVTKIVIHLLRNAIFYTPKGGHIALTATAEDGGVRISVRDTGIGMKPEEVARLGEPFYRADHELVFNQKGYGLGIPVTMGLLGLMGSRLDIQTAPNAGSTFSFALRGE